MLHEAWVVDQSLIEAVAAFRTPLATMDRFSFVRQQNAVAILRKRDSAFGDGVEGQFVLAMADFRGQEKHDAKARVSMDF